jgi:hypothetical protein
VLTVRDWRDRRDWRRIWRDLPGLGRFWPCGCCGGGSSSSKGPYYTPAACTVYGAPHQNDLHCNWPNKRTATFVDLTGKCPGFNGLTISLDYSKTVFPTPHDGAVFCTCGYSTLANLNANEGWYGEAHACATTIKVFANCLGAQDCAPPWLWLPWCCIWMIPDQPTINGCTNTGLSTCTQGMEIYITNQSCDSMTFWSNSTPGGCQNGGTLNHVSCVMTAPGCCDIGNWSGGNTFKMIVTP